MNYWGYRIDVNKRDYFFKEIQNGNLRQGWGYDAEQDLRKADKKDVLAKRNFAIYNKVKKGDLLLVPRVEAWDEVAIVEAIQDFDDKDNGYRFEIDPEIGDYGHIFPVKLVKCFSRHNDHVGGVIRETLKCRSRFWNINRCAKEIEEILNTPEPKLRSISSYEERIRKHVESAFNENLFANSVYDELNKSTQASEWEFVLCAGFKRMFPDSYTIETTSNKREKEHGADIIIRIPGIQDNTYIIAIQVKDYSSAVDAGTIDQICKADGFFLKEEGAILIDKYLIITKAKSQVNEDLINYARNKNVKILFDKEVKKLLSKMGRAFIADGIYA